MEKMQFIAQFSYNDKIFHLVLFKNRINCLCFDKDGNSCLSLNEDEKGAIVDVVRGLMIDEKRSSYVRDDNVNGRGYKIYCDPVTRNYFWKSEDGKDYASDNVFFNMKYNHMPSVVYFWKGSRTYEEELDRKLKKYFVRWAIEDLEHIYDYEKRIRMKEVYVRQGRKGRVKSILVSGAICLSGIFALGMLNNIFVTSMEGMFGEDWKNVFSDISVVETIDTEYTSPNYLDEATETTEYVIEIPETTEVVEEKDEYSWEVIRGAIERNPNLTEVEKNFLYELQFVFDENHQYMDLEMVVARLETLRITYESGICPDDPSIGGKYYPANNDNMIVNYNSTEFKDVVIDVFVHELMHVFQVPSHYNLTTELSNELFTREVLRRLHVNGVLDKFGKNIPYNTPGYYKYGDGYEPWMNMWYDVVEIIPQEDLCEFQFQSDEVILAEALSDDKSYGYDYQKAWRLIDLVNYSKNKLEFNYLPGEVSEQIDSELEYFYQLDGMSITKNANCFANDLSFSTTFSKNGADFLLETLGKSQYLEYDDCMMMHTGAQMKTYFSDAFPETTIHLEFIGRGNDSELGLGILKANEDYNKSYVIVVDDEFELEYSNYVSSNSTKSR